jgi:hypothetical protein
MAPSMVACHQEIRNPFSGHPIVPVAKTSQNHLPLLPLANIPLVPSVTDLIEDPAYLQAMS